MTSEDIASKKGAQLAAGRRKLEEFKRRKLLAVRRQQEQLEEQHQQQISPSAAKLQTAITIRTFPYRHNAQSTSAARDHTLPCSK